MARPVALGVEPGEAARERGVAPAAGQPGGVVDQAQGAQGFYPAQLARCEITEFVVTLYQLGELQLAFMTLAAQAHPQVLHRRCHATVVQVDEVSAVVAPEDVADVAVAMHADQVFVLHLAVQRQNHRQQVAGEAVVGRLQVAGNKVLQQVAAVVREHILDAQRGAILEARAGAHCVDAAQSAAQHQQAVHVIQFRRVAAAARKERKAKALVPVQAVAGGVNQWCDHRDFRVL